MHPKNLIESRINKIVDFSSYKELSNLVNFKRIKHHFFIREIVGKWS